MFYTMSHFYWHRCCVECSITSDKVGKVKAEGTPSKFLFINKTSSIYYPYLSYYECCLSPPFSHLILIYLVTSLSIYSHMGNAIKDL